MLATTSVSGAGGSRLWTTLRALSDVDRQHIERVLSRFRSLDGVSSSNDSDDNSTNNNSPLVVTVDSQQYEPLAFVQALLNHLHERAHEQSRVDMTPERDVTLETTNQTQEPRFQLEQEEFPSLGKATAMPSTVPTKATKRRITTTLISTDAPYAAVTVKPPSTTPTPVDMNNAWAKRSLLEKRMVKIDPALATGPSPVKPSLERRAALLMGDETPPVAPPTVQGQAFNPWMSPPPTKTQADRKPPSLTLVGKPKRSKRVSLQSPSQDSPDTHKTVPVDKAVELMSRNKPVEPNLQAARLYGHIIVQRLVPNICSELQFLVGLLYRQTCGSATSTTHSTCTPTNEFCDANTSVAFAAAAIETLEPILILLGSDMVQLVAKSLEDVKQCESLVVRLRNAMETREEQRVQESAKMGCELPVETKGTAFRDYALPFCEDMDSRLNYRTPTESVIYSNREKIRDAFLAQLRTYQRKQNSLQGAEADTQGSSSASQDVQQLLRDVMPENLWWFARFFVLELVQIGSNPLGESDKDLVLKIMEDKMVVKNPDRLRKLHRRFSSQKVSDSNVGASTTTGFPGAKSKNSNRQPTRHGGGSNSITTKTDKGKLNGSNDNNDNKSSVRGDSGEASRLKDHMRSFFSDNQAFFYHFLASCDSYQFAELVKYQLEAQFLSIWRAKLKTDPRKEFTETVLRLKTLAKFIGYLRFSPQWHWSAFSSALSSKNPALEAAQREAVKTLEQSQSANAFDVVGLLEESIVSRTVAKSTPWLCDYFSMLSSDTLSSSTRNVQRALILMAYVHRSRMLDSLGETGLFVAMQIERLFQLLAAQELVPKGMMWYQINDKHPPWMKEATAQALLLGNGPSAPEYHTDDLPFLYSSMIVQVCVSELDDLRGFIQTRSNPHHRSAGVRRGNLLGSKTSAIRKVRPLQVVSEEHVDLAPSSVRSDGNADRVDPATKNESVSDPLRDAFFKLYPQLKHAVEFVVDMVVINICEHAVNKYVKPNADALIDSCVEDAKENAPAFTQLILHGFQIRLDERLEDFMTTTVTKALEEARSLCVARVHAALKPLVPPSTPTQLVSAATKIAQAQATAAITNLITRSLRTEFLKRVAMRKRAIVKEAGTTAVAESSQGDTSSGSDNPSSKDSVTRALTFSFDDSGDPEHTPLEEALHSLKSNVVAINGLLQTRRESCVATRTLASFTRFERGFRGALEDAIEELSLSDEQIQRSVSLLLWSWIWRGVRLSLKLFSTLITCACAEHAPRVGGIVANCAKTLAVIATLPRQSSGESVEDPMRTICRFVAQTAQALSVNIVKDEPQRSASQDHVAVYSSACSTLYDHAVALSPASPY